MVLFPNAKINIGLNIVKKRADGFHDIESCFYPVGWSDVLEIIPASQLSFNAQGIPIPGNSDQNLCLKAFELIQQDYPIPNVEIELLKAVPIGAGLGGGSSDAAFTIMGLSDLFDLGLSEAQKIAYARRLGSDCAFFVKNIPTFCTGKGDVFEEIPLSLADKWIVLVNPGIHISTAEAYAGIVAKRSEHDLRALLSLPIDQWEGLIKNDFEEALVNKYPYIGQIKTELYQLGAHYAAMTGSGSTVYGIFEKKTEIFNYFSNCTVWQGTIK